MSVPLVTGSMGVVRLGPGVCDNCKQPRAETFGITVQLPSMHTQSDPLCYDCLREPLSQVLVFDPNIKAVAGPPSKAIRRTSKKREIQHAKDIGGRRQPASGALPHAKGDFRKKGEWRGEDKVTTKNGFTITRELFAKIRSECAYGEKPVITLGFVNPHTHLEEENLAIIDLQTWKDLVNAARSDK